MSDVDAMTDVEVLQATEQIRLLEARYARFADEKRWADLARLFTPDGTFTSLNVDGETLAAMAGRQEITDNLSAVTAGDVIPIHLLTTSEIEILSPTRAHGIWAMADLIFRNQDPPADPAASGGIPPFQTMRGWGHYHVDYVKVAGGWLISQRLQTRTRLEFTG
jgi:SnoaL-like domain